MIVAFQVINISCYKIYHPYSKLHEKKGFTQGFILVVSQNFLLLLHHQLNCHHLHRNLQYGCRTSKNSRVIGLAIFRLLFDLIGSLESPPSNLWKATRKPDQLVLSEIHE
jgi:hypothetical protein